MNINDIISFIGSATEEELKSIRGHVNGELEHRADLIKYSLYIGCRVTFPNKSGNIIEGTVMKINPKNVKIQVEDKDGRITRWNVHSSFLTKADRQTKLAHV